jgi:hypothetical protein
LLLGMWPITPAWNIPGVGAIVVRFGAARQ